ncbi:MAG: hypothetical protein IBX55_09870 [Methyloprofundus sp.]|nr:hypothetical protein [Methyloprofundus sp.]
MEHAFISDLSRLTYDAALDMTILNCISDRDKTCLSFSGKPSDNFLLNLKQDPYGCSVYFLTVKAPSALPGFELRKSVDQLYVKDLIKTFQLEEVVHQGLMG